MELNQKKKINKNHTDNYGDEERIQRKPKISSPIIMLDPHSIRNHIKIKST